MKYIFLSIVSILLLSFFDVTATRAATPEQEVMDMNELDALSTAESAPVSTLVLIDVDTIDDKHVVVGFSETVDIKTLKLNIQKQSDNSTVRFASLTGATDRPNAVLITLVNSLEEGSAYTLTIVSAIGETGAVIRDGALALRDFVTPVPLKKYEEVLNAPTNPNAVVASTGATNTVTVVPVVPEPQKPTTPPPTKKEDPKQPVPTQELPLTGMNPIYILLLSCLGVLLFMRRRAQ